MADQDVAWPGDFSTGFNGFEVSVAQAAYGIGILLMYGSRGKR
jgi:hypothetical protein